MRYKDKNINDKDINENEMVDAKDKQIKKINIIKIIVFISIIVVPILNLNLKRDQVSEIDNRMLMNLEDIFAEGDISSNIESYLDDRIGFRTQMINSYNRGMDILFDEMMHPSYQYGEDGYVFFKVSENEFDSEFQEVYSDFIKGLQEYCESRGIEFLYTVEPSKATVYEEFLPKGYVYDNKNLDYFLSLLEQKNINYLNNAEVLEEAKENIQVFDVKYDAGHWNETGAMIGISAILDSLNKLDNRVGSFDTSKFEEEKYINTTLPASYFSINESTTHYNLIQDNSEYISDLEKEVKREENFRYFSHYKNNVNTDGPRILIFAGSYFNNKEKFLTENFSELMKIHNYRNVINYEYYINIFKPDIVLFESTEYTHKDYYFPVDRMKNKVHIKNIDEYSNLNEDSFVYIENDSLKKAETNLTNFSIPIDSDDVLFAYAYINNRMLDCKINEIDNQKYVEFSIMTSEIKDTNNFDLYFISKDEERYQKASFRLD